MQAINCSYAKVAVRAFTNKHSLRNKRLPKNGIEKVVQDFNHQFNGYSNFEVDMTTAKKRFPVV